MTSGLPTWVAVLTAGAAVVGACGILFTYLRKAIRGLNRFVTAVNTMYPMVALLTQTFADSPRAFSVLDDIARQFGSDSGSSLRDAIDRLEKSSAENRQAAELLKVGVEASRQLAERDREDYRAILQRIDRVSVRVDAGDVKLDQAAVERQHMTEQLEKQEPKP